MSFDKLIEKVEQAEQALEAKERTAAADWRQFRQSWKEGWTPGRIVLAGLASGFIVGRMEPVARRGGGGMLQMVTALSGLFAGGSAQVAAEKADDAVDTARRAASAAEPSVADYADAYRQQGDL